MTPRPIPIVLVGDAPTQPTGLARIARDLAEIITTAIPEAELHFVGFEPPLGSWAGWSGPFPLWTFSNAAKWGGPLVTRVCEHLEQQGYPPGIVWPIWDADRAHELMLNPGWELWLYPAVDSVNRLGGFDGPGAAAVRRADRVVAYGDWAAGVLSNVRRQEVPAIPHMLHHAYYDRTVGPDPRNTQVTIGCVATNQPRKDLNLFFATCRVLQERGHDVRGWLHTDRISNSAAWYVPGLIREHRLSASQFTLTTSDVHTTDSWLRGMMDQSRVSIAVGRGEGFGYPIVEFMARGVPVVHADYAGGAELIPAEWRIRPVSWTTEGPYGLKRPVLDPAHVADRIEAILLQPDATKLAREAADRYHQNSVIPRWIEWIQDGVREKQRRG